MGWGSKSHASAWITKAEAHAVFDVLSSFVDSVTGIVTIALTQIAEYSALEKSQVQRGLRELRRMRVIVPAPPGRNGTRSYEIHPIFVIRKGAECPSPRELRRLFDELQSGSDEVSQGATPESLGGYSTVSMGLLQGSQKGYSPVALSQYLYSHLYSHNVETVAPQVSGVDRSALPPVQEQVAEIEIPLVAETVAAATPKKARRAKRPPEAPSPEVLDVVRFYESVYCERFPLEKLSAQWVFKTRAAAKRLLTLGTAFEVKERIRRCHNDFRRREPSAFGALHMLYGAWSVYAMGRDEAGVAGMPMRMSEAKPKVLPPVAEADGEAVAGHLGAMLSMLYVNSESEMQEAQAR